MRRRYQAYTLKENAYGTAYPSPPEHTIDMSMLNGGLNLWELEYRMSPNQSPDCLNVWWRDGCLSSRPGQDYIYYAVPEDEATQDNPQDTYGSFYAGYGRLWHDRWICQKGTKLYAVNPETGSHTQVYSGTLTEEYGGSFFEYKEKLYYMNGHEYVVLKVEYGDIVADDVVPYIPTVVMNRKPDGTAGDLYEDENRIAAGKKVKFTSDGTSTQYQLPYKGLDNTPAMTAVVNGTSMTEGSGFSVNRATGVVTFTTAPSQSSLPVVNNVEITCYKTDEDAENSVLNCKVATAYGNGTINVIVCGGTPAQPNAYFWSGSTSVGLDPTYFPYDHYNFAGTNDDFITGLAKQQNMLVIFKEHSIGKSVLDTTELDGLTHINLPYTAVNDAIGCSFEKTIQLIENNLVFANKEGGVYVLRDTSSANENNVQRISRNVNGSGSTKGVLYDLRRAEASTTCAYDDGKRYWLCANGKVYVWDYEISSFYSKEEKLSWFLLDGINPVAWLKTPDLDCYGRKDGSLVKFGNTFSDFGEGFMRRYTFAVQHFGTYDVLKDVQRVIFTVKSGTGCLINIRYRTDYEERDDLTLVDLRGLTLVPRDLSQRILRVIKFAAIGIRTPRCFHIRHFSMTLYNDVANTDISLIGAQIVYRYSRRDR